MKARLPSLTRLWFACACANFVVPAVAFAELELPKRQALSKSRALHGSVPSKDGVPIAYRTLGSGDTALVFIHGWACDSSFWSYQLEEFGTQTRVVAVDLAGHGASGANRESWTMAKFGEDVRAVVSKLALRRVVLVGHSLGGLVALEAARLLPKETIAVVPIDVLFDTTLPIPDLAKVLVDFERDYPKTLRAFVDGMFLPDDKSQARSLVTRAMLKAPRHIAVPVLRMATAFSIPLALAAVKVAIHAVNNGENQTNELGLRKAASRSQAFTFRYMNRVGHFLMLEDPSSFNQNLRQILTQELKLPLARRW